MHTLWRDGVRKPDPDESIAWDFVLAMKREKNPFAGLRMVLVGVAGEMMPGYHPVGERAAVVVSSGQFEAAQDYLNLAIARGNLASNDLEWCEGALEYCKRDREEDHEDWSGLVARSAAFAEKRGYVTEPFASDWMYHGWRGVNEDCAAAYEKAGITGSFMRIGDLPGEIRENQLLGESFPMSILIRDKVIIVDRPITTNTLVQVLTCDFTGDGRKDLVLEECGAVGSDGYWYDFYRQLPNGSYTNVYRAQVVGLCALPRKDGGACAFLLVGKLSNPVLETKLLSFDHGESSLADANMRSFFMLDAKEDELHCHAPFIGGGMGSAGASSRDVAFGIVRSSGRGDRARCRAMTKPSSRRRGRRRNRKRRRSAWMRPRENGTAVCHACGLRHADCRAGYVPAGGNQDPSTGSGSGNSR